MTKMNFEDTISREESAFPVISGAESSGLSIRDWMATAALQGLAAKGLEIQADRAMTQKEKDLAMAMQAYRLADAMLIVRRENAV